MGVEGILATRFRESVAKLKDYRMKSEAEFNVGYPTGFLNFDFRNGVVVHVKSEVQDFKYYSVGITDGSMVMIIGRSGSGKTTFVIQSAANIIRKYNTSCIFHDDIEAGVTQTRIEQLTGFQGEELNKRYIRRSAGITAENFYERIKMIHDLKMDHYDDYEYDTGYFDTSGNRIFKLEPTVYILDSLALLMPSQYTEEEELSGQMSSTAAAKANAMIFKRIIPMLKSANIILFIINHINMKISINPMQRTKSQVSYLKQDESLPGGNTPIYLANLMIRVDDNSKLKSTEAFGIDGSITEITLVKSRANKAGKSVNLVFNQSTGFDQDLSLFLMLKENNRINGAGAYLYIDDRSDLKFAQKNFKGKLNEDMEFKSIFMKAVAEVLQENIENDSAVITEAEEEKINDIADGILSSLNAIPA